MCAAPAPKRPEPPPVHADADGFSAIDVARRLPMSEAQLSALRWGLIGGLPVVILLAGALWRLARG